MNTRTVKFSYGTVKDASLKIPAEAYSVVDAVKLIRESYLEYMFRPGCGLMSDEVLVSSIGQANFFAGALGGYESRVDAEFFKNMQSYINHAPGLALAVAEYREPTATRKQHYIRASKNESLSATERKFLALLSEDAA
jgi:hypothetical protein